MVTCQFNREASRKVRERNSVDFSARPIYTLHSWCQPYLAWNSELLSKNIVLRCKTCLTGQTVFATGVLRNYKITIALFHNANVAVTWVILVQSCQTFFLWPSSRCVYVSVYVSIHMCVHTLCLQRDSRSRSGTGTLEILVGFEEGGHDRGGTLRTAWQRKPYKRRRHTRLIASVKLASQTAAPCHSHAQPHQIATSLHHQSSAQSKFTFTQSLQFFTFYKC